MSPVRLRLDRGRAEAVLVDGRESPPVHRDAARELARLAAEHPGAVLAWHEKSLEPWLADPAGLLRHRLEVIHLGAMQRMDLRVRSLGRVDFDSPWLIAGPTDRRFATWLISPAAGAGHAAVLRGLDPSAPSFAAALLDLGRRGIAEGLCPVSDPALLRGSPPEEIWDRRPLPAREIAWLVRRGYGRKWLVFWLLGEMRAGRWPLLAALRGAVAAAPPRMDLAALPPPLPEIDPAELSVDVLIPTLGRPAPLRDVLADLALQTVQPRRVIVIDQSAEGSGMPEGSWPFELRGLSLPVPGACRARNLGLREVASDWVLLLDDDVRFSPDLIEHLVRVARAYGAEAVNAGVHLAHQAPPDASPPRFFSAFAGCAVLVDAAALARAGDFDERLEGSYGEDWEIGMRLRLRGALVLLAPGGPVLHLKAPSGGFRQLPPLPWAGEPVQPKPAPGLLYARGKHLTREMQEGYRLFYALRRLASVSPLAWPRELRSLSRQWERAFFWAERLRDLPVEGP